METKELNACFAGLASPLQYVSLALLLLIPSSLHQRSGAFYCSKVCSCDIVMLVTVNGNDYV